MADLHAKYTRVNFLIAFEQLHAALITRKMRVFIAGNFPPLLLHASCVYFFNCRSKRNRKMLIVHNRFTFHCALNKRKPLTRTLHIRYIFIFLR